MKLKKLEIDKFKNLNTIFDFSNNNGTTVLIGNNGSGKSSVLEVISEIFFHIFNDTLDDVTFKFELKYEINNTDIRIKKNRVVKYEKKALNRATYTKIDYNQLKEYLPSKLLALYSGEDSRLWDEYYKKPYITYMEEIRDEYQIFPSLKLFYVNKYYWDIALLTLLYSPLAINNDFCKRILKIDSLDDIEIKFKFNINNLTNFKQNIVTAFIANLSLNNNAKTYKVNVFKELEFIGSDKELFIKLMASIMDKNSSYKLIDELTITIDNNKNITSKDLSEGEKKQILIRVALEIVADENSLILFDEPDANIHVANKSQIKTMLDEYITREAILTTHSPTLMNLFEENLIYLENGQNIGKEKAEILREISGDTMSDAQRQILLNSKTDILIVEGKTDEMYISVALEKLKTIYPKYTNLNFNFLYMGGSDPETLEKLISGFQPRNNQAIIAFFDRDGAGLKCIKNVLNYNGNKDDFIGDVKNNIHIYFYPKKDGFTDSDFEVEDYFNITTCRDFLFNNFRTFQDTKKKFKKVEFANFCRSLNVEEFEGFKTLFDLILRIKEI